MEPTIGEIRMFAGNFAPRSWALCEGQLLAINSNQALFSILGTTYGGDGRTSFGLPDLRGRANVGPGNGPGLSDRRLGAKGGTEYNILNSTQIPSHNHSMNVKVSSGNATVSSAVNGVSTATPGETSGRAFVPSLGYNSETPNISLTQQSVIVGNTGANQSVNNMQPWLGLNFIICLFGLFPSRS